LFFHAIDNKGFFMFRIKFLPAIIFALFQLCMSHQLSAMEKEHIKGTESNIRYAEDKSGLRETEKKSLALNRWAMGQVCELSDAKGVRNFISQKEYDLIKPITFICPTVEELKRNADKYRVRDITLTDNDIYPGYRISGDINLPFPSNVSFKRIKEIEKFSAVR
jgi:hypothetical protein